VGGRRHLVPSNPPAARNEPLVSATSPKLLPRETVMRARSVLFCPVNVWVAGSKRTAPLLAPYLLTTRTEPLLHVTALPPFIPRHI
jgi:hypothetical protein